MTKKISAESVLEEIKRNLGEEEIKKLIEQDEEGFLSKVGRFFSKSAERGYGGPASPTASDVASSAGKAISSTADSVASGISGAIGDLSKRKERGYDAEPGKPAPSTTPGARKDMPGFKPKPEPSGDDLYKDKGSQANAPETKSEPSAPVPNKGPQPPISTKVEPPKSVSPPARSAAPTEPAKPQVPNAPAKPQVPNAPAKPKAPTAPAKPQAPTTSGDESNAEYWNREAERNRAQGGKPLPNEWNIFGKKETTPAPSAPAPARPVPRAAPRPAPRAATPGISGSSAKIEENFDQFVKRFIKESK